MKIKLKNLILVLYMSLFIMAIFAMPVFSDNNFKNSKENFTVKAMGTLFNLNYGGIIADSERVYLNNVLLDKSVYTLDCGAAILNINKFLSIGDRIEVDYCYVPDTAKTSATTLQKSLNMLQYTNANVSTNMSLLYNAVDATTGNATYGTNFKTNLGSNISIDSSYFTSVGEKEGDFNLHKLAYNNNGLSINLGYQDSSADFNGMNYATSAGVDSGVATEAGLKRTNFGLNYAFSNNSLLKFDYNTVSDDEGTLTNTNVAFSNNKLNFAYTTQNIGEMTSFDKLRDSDKAILAAEKGIKRNSLTFGYDFGVKGGKLSYSQNGIDYNDSSISSQTLNYEGQKYKYSFYNRNVDSSFNNFTSLRDSDKAQIALESGISRTSHDFSFDIGKKDAANWQNISMLSLKTEDGKELKSNTYSVNYNSFEGQYFTLNIDNDFNRMNAMNATERNNFSGFARKLFNYGQGVGNIDDVDRNSWYNQNGINRDMKFLKYNLNGGNLIYTGQKLSLDSGAGLNTNRFSYAGKYKGKDVSFYYNEDKIDEDFNRLSNLTNIEKTNYNNMYGMNNLNYGLEGTFGLGYIKYTNNKITDNINDSGFSRSYLNYVLPKYNFTKIDTKFDNAFTRINDISDPDRASYLQGFNKTEYTANMNFGSASKTFTVNNYLMNAGHQVDDKKYSQRSTTVNYVPDAKFNISYYSNDYKYEVDDDYAINNKETIIKMNKIFNVAKLNNNSFYTQYRTNSYLENGVPINQKFMDFSYKSDTNAKFVLNMDYNIAQFSETDKRRGYDLYATQMLANNLGLTFGMGKTNYLNADAENRIKYGVTYKISDTFNIAYNIDKVTKGNDKSKDNSSFVVSGKLPQFISKNILSDITANFKYDLNKSNEVRNLYNDNYSISGKFLKGDFKVEKASVLDSTTQSWYNDSSTISYKNNSIFGSKLSVEYLSQATTNATSKVTGETQLYKFNYSLNDKLSTSYSLTKGQWYNNNLVPVKSEEFSLTSKISSDKNFSLKYTRAKNSITNKNERNWSLAFSMDGTKTKGKFNIIAGLSSIYNSTSSEKSKTAFTYGVRYEYMLSKEHFLSIAASRTSRVYTSTLESDYDDETMGLDYRQSF